MIATTLPAPPPSVDCPRCGAPSHLFQEAEPDAGLLSDTHECDTCGLWWRKAWEPGQPLNTYVFEADHRTTTASGDPEAITLDDLLRAKKSLEELEVPKHGAGLYAVHMNPHNARMFVVAYDAQALLLHLDLSLAVGPSGGGPRRARDRRRMVRARAMLRSRRRRPIETREAINRAALDALPVGDRPRLTYLESPVSGAIPGGVSILGNAAIPDGVTVFEQTPIPPTMRSL